LETRETKLSDRFSDDLKDSRASSLESGVVENGIRITALKCGDQGDPAFATGVRR